MAFKFLRTSGPHCDSFTTFNVVTDKEYTVDEFIQEVTCKRAAEWGVFVIAKDLKRASATIVDKCEYEYGEIKKGFENCDCGNLKISDIKARGGWTAMDYLIQPKENDRVYDG